MMVLIELEVSHPGLRSNCHVIIFPHIQGVSFDECRAKITHDLAQVINDGLFHYEEDLWNDDEGDWVILLFSPIVSF